MTDRELVRQSFDVWMASVHVTWTPCPEVRAHLYLAFLSGLALGKEHKFDFDTIKAEVDACFEKMWQTK